MTAVPTNLPGDDKPEKTSKVVDESLDRKLDEALEESFPARDPAAIGA